jgi:hypothetical protein
MKKPYNRKNVVEVWLRPAFFFIFMIIGVSVAWCQPPRERPRDGAQSSSELHDTEEYSKDYEETLKGSSAYSKLINYFRREKGSTKEVPRLKTKDAVPVAVADVLVSLFSLCLALLVFDRAKAANWRGYLWFLFIFNVFWFVFMVLSMVMWNMAEFLVVRLRPDLQAFVSDNFILLIFAGAVFLYIWQIARAFQLSFFGTLLVNIFSHALYLAIIFSFSLSAQSAGLLKLLTDNLGVRTITRNYIADVDRISSGGNIVSFLRLRPFHI